jgi:aspartyl-tRNA(Asn)/glutamyl-tRNA(Gln) amidotransferase subunit C
MQLTSDDVKAIALLARVGVSETDVERLREQFSAILEYVEILNELDVSHVEEAKHMIDFENVYREDVVTVDDEQLRKDLMENVPRAKDGFIVVSAVL